MPTDARCLWGSLWPLQEIEPTFIFIAVPDYFIYMSESNFLFTSWTRKTCCHLGCW